MTNNSFRKVIENLTSDKGFKQIPFADFLEEFRSSGHLIFRNIFQLFHDMVRYYTEEIKDEYPFDSESIGFLYYNLDELFIHDTDRPFFADRLFSNRLVNLANSFRMSAPRNKIYLFRGPAGSGKSTFLNNLLFKFEQYVRSEEGLLYEVSWRIPTESVNVESLRNRDHSDSVQIYRRSPEKPEFPFKPVGEYFEVPCPNHDNPFLLIPEAHRVELLREIIPDGDFKKKLFKHKQYQWVLKDDPCTICTSIFDALMEKYSVEEIFSMIYAKRYFFSRKQGIGVSVFNSGDDLDKNVVKANEQIQHFLNTFFKDSNKVRYLFSGYAHTNHGIMALMDLKAKNIQRFLDLHGIISDEVHKVSDIEERIKSMFIVLANPGDLELIGGEGRHDDDDDDDEESSIDNSLKDRIHEILVPYVLDYNTEIRIYINTFGEQIKLRFMPHVLENFAKIIVASRIRKESKAIKDWLKDDDEYEKYCDPDYFILKMDLYTGIIPDWLTKDDRISFKADVRKRIISEAEEEGHFGFSGRESNQLFDEFYSKYSKKRPITLHHLTEFFMDENRELKDKLPKNFLKHLTDLYDFEVLKEVRDSIYNYNDDEISRSIINYLVAITQNVGDTIKNPFLDNDEIAVTNDFLDIVETHLIGHNASPIVKSRFRADALTEYASVTLAKEIKCEGRRITETKQYQEMFAQFTKTARQSVLEPYVGNNNFRCAIKEYGTNDFLKYDSKIKERIELLFKNLAEKYKYSPDCAKAVCIYVLDNNLVEKFDES